jgi:hypothetical protein
MVYNIMNTVRIKVDKLNKAIGECDGNSVLFASEASEWLEHAWHAPIQDLPEGLDIKEYGHYRKKITELSSEFKNRCSCRAK